MRSRNFVCTILLSIASAGATTITTGETVRALLRTTPMDYPCAGACDKVALAFENWGSSGLPDAMIRLQADLSDGKKLIRSYGILVCCAGADLKSSTTIEPQMDSLTITNSFGVGAPHVVLNLPNAGGPAGAGMRVGAVSINKPNPATPEPGTMGLASALLALGIAVQRGRRAS